MELEKIDLIDLYPLTLWDPVGNALDGCCNSRCSDRTKEKSRRRLYCVGADLKRVLRGKKSRTKIGRYVLKPVVIELLAQNVGRVIGEGFREDPLLKVASMFRKAFSQEFIYDMSGDRQQLFALFDEAGLHADKLLRCLIDPEKYLQSDY